MSEREDLGVCAFCGAMVEAGSGCDCSYDDPEDYGDYLYHAQKDEEAERREL